MVFRLFETKTQIIIIPHDDRADDWIDMMRNCFPDWYIGCWFGYDDCLWTHKN